MNDILITHSLCYRFNLMDVCDSLLLRESINEMTRSHPLLYICICFVRERTSNSEVNDKFNQICFNTVNSFTQQMFAGIQCVIY
jgi:hypothetical protein